MARSLHMIYWYIKFMEKGMETVRHTIIEKHLSPCKQIGQVYMSGR